MNYIAVTDVNGEATRPCICICFVGENNNSGSSWMIEGIFTNRVAVLVERKRSAVQYSAISTWVYESEVLRLL